MNSYEKIINTIRRESDRNKEKYPLKIGIMQSGKKCLLGSLELDEDDILINSALKGILKKDDKVLICRVSADYYVIISKVEAI